MTLADAVDAIVSGTVTALAIIGALTMVDTVLLSIGARRSLIQAISHAWHSRPRRVLSRARRTWPQGPGN